MSSYKQSFAYTCTHCGHAGAANIWLVVDAFERPDLLEQIVDGTNRTCACEQKRDSSQCR